MMQRIVMFFIASLFVAASLIAEQPGSTPPSSAIGPGRSLVPSAGYRRTVELLRLSREIGIPGIAAAPGVSLQLSGVRSVPVICVEYANRSHDFDTDAYQALLFDDPSTIPSPPNPTFTQYYRDISNGQFIPTGQVFGWFILPEDDTFYELANNGLNERLVEMLKFAFEKADAEVDFGQFDNDGPDGLPNSGDDDGIVDTIFIVHSELGGECGPRGVNKNMWSHSFQYSEFDSTSGPFVTNDVRRDQFGQPVIGANNKIRIEDYTVQPGVSCNSTSATPEIIPIGVFCHEYGHALGLPDLYDRTPASRADSEGVGNYCLMAGGSYGADGKNAAIPVHMSAWCKSLMGWATIVDIAANQEIDLEPVAERNLVYNVDVPDTDGKEFFLIEYRDGTWADQFGERINWDREFNPSGIAIWHVDERVGETSPDWPFADRGQGQNDDPSMPNSGGTEFKSKRSLVALVQRDRKLHLERKQNRADADDLFLDGTDFGDDPDLRGGSRSYEAKATGISLKSIDFDTAKAMVRIDDFPSGVAPPTSPAIAAAAPIAAIPNPPVAAQVELEATSKQYVQSKAVQFGAEALSSRELWELSKEGPSFVQHTLPPKQAHDVLMRSAQVRTETVEKGAGSRADLDHRVQDIIASSKTPNATVRFTADHKQIERISGVRLEVEGGNVAEDALKRINEIRDSMATQSTRLDTTNPKVTDGKIVFPQVVDVEGKPVRMHCRGITLYYDGGEFVGAESNTIEPEELKVTGKVPDESDDALLGRISKQMHVDPSRLRVDGQCIVLRGGVAKDARVATQVNVKVGGKRDDIHVLVDGETGKVLEIE